MYLEIFLGVLSALIVQEVYHFVLGFYFAKKQEREVKRIQREMEEKGITPEMAMGMLGSIGAVPDTPPQKASTEVPAAKVDQSGTGQYL